MSRAKTYPRIDGLKQTDVADADVIITKGKKVYTVHVYARLDGIELHIQGPNGLKQLEAVSFTDEEL